MPASPRTLSCRAEINLKLSVDSLGRSSLYWACCVEGYYTYGSNHTRADAQGGCRYL